MPEANARPADGHVAAAPGPSDRRRVPRGVFSNLSLSPNLSLSRRVALIPALTLLLMGLMLTAVVLRGQRSTASLRALDRDVFEPLHRAQTMKDEITLLHTRLFALLSIANNETDPAAQKAGAEAVIARLDGETANFGGFLDTTAAVPPPDAARLREEFSDYARRVRDTANFAAYDASYGAMLVEGTDDSFGHLRGNLDALVLTLEQRRAMLTELAVDESVDAGRLVFSVGIGLALLGLLGSVVVGRGISRPLLRLTARMNQLAQGETGLAVPGTARRDEIGAMARAVEVFNENAVRNVALIAENQEVVERQARVKAESQAKSSFLAMMSHEIRTPMNGILGIAGSMLDTPLMEGQRKSIQIIRESGDTLLRILNDILDFSKLDGGQMALEAIPFSPATLTENPISLLAPRAIAKGLKIDAIIGDDLPPLLLGDAGRIRQVLLNLVSNAVKFTGHGSVRITASCPERDEHSAVIVWVVSDTGIGIPADRIGQLFREFSQADPSITRRFGGSGLGLAISKRLIERMDGTVAVESATDRGSAFTVTLRLPIASGVAGAVAGPVDSLGAFRVQLKHLGRAARILLAEDNATNQMVAVQLLRGFDVKIDVASDGVEAVHAASSFAYDAIFMDMRMPEMDGLAATRAIRTLGGRLATVPIIALTANAFPEDIAACSDAGMTGFVAKPVNKESLVAALLSALGGTEPVNSIGPSPDRGEPALDRVSFGLLKTDLEEDGVADLVAMFEDETRDRFARIADRRLQAETLTREIHSLKGAAATACAALLSRRAADLELRLKRDGRMTDEDLAALTEAFEAWHLEVRLADDHAGAADRRLLCSN